MGQLRRQPKAIDQAYLDDDVGDRFGQLDRLAAALETYADTSRLLRGQRLGTI